MIKTTRVNLENKLSMKVAIYALRKALNSIVIFKIFSTLIITFLVVPHFSLSVYAQEAGITQTPSTVELVAQPGQTVEVKFVVGNVGDNLPLTSSLTGFKPTGVQGHVTFDTELTSPLRFALKNNNLHLDEPYILLEGNGQELVLEIRIPDNTPEGDYYFALTTTHEIGRIPAGSTSLTHKIHVSSFILISVNPDGYTDHQGEIGEFRVDSPKKYFETNQPIPFKLIVNNVGKNLIKPRGYLIIRGPGVNKRLSLVSENVLSGYSRQLMVQDGKIIKGFFIGRYTVQAFVDTGSQIIRAQFTFISIPTRILISLATLIGLVMSAIIIVRKQEGRTTS